MKRLLITLSLAVVILAAFTEEKKFTVSFTQSEWEARYNWIEAAKEQLKRSDLPSKTVVFINDSLLGKFQADLANQLRPQFIAAADTTKKKSK
jgi:hypothetical protein